MRNLGIYISIPIVILLLGLIFLIITILPASWRVRLLALAALLLVAIPLGSAAGPPAPTCYKMAAPEDYIKLTNTPQWALYRTSYLTLLDYIASREYSEQVYKGLLANLQKAEAELKSQINDKAFPSNTANALFDGIDRYSETYQGGEAGITCYMPVQTPEFVRNMTLFNIVGRQVQLHKLIKAGTPISVATMAQIKADNYNSIKQYLGGNDLDVYVDLTDDLMATK